MMRTWLSQHGYVFLFTLKQLLARPVTNICSILVMGIALSLPVGAYTLIENLHALSGQVTDMPQMSLFVKVGADEKDIVNIKQKLEKEERIVDFQYVPKETALQQLQQSSGLTNITHHLGHNPLPDAFLIHTQKNTTEALEQLRTTMQNWPGIEWVQFDSDWIERLNAILDLSRAAMFMLSILLSVAIIAVMFNTIRLQILTKRDEIEISKLIGATDSFIQRPFLYFGAIQGLAGGFVAWLIMIFAINMLNQKLIDLTQLYNSNFHLYYLSPADSISLLFFSAWLGWLGARISVASHLWQIEAK